MMPMHIQVAEGAPDELVEAIGEGADNVRIEDGYMILYKGVEAVVIPWTKIDFVRVPISVVGR